MVYYAPKSYSDYQGPCITPCCNTCVEVMGEKIEKLNAMHSSSERRYLSTDMSDKNR